MSMRAPLAIALLALLGACASTRPRASKREDSAALISERERARPDADPAWQRLYAATDLRGEPVAPALEETPLTLVIVFATWCEHCRTELAVLAELREQEEKVSIVGINAYEEWG